MVREAVKIEKKKCKIFHTFLRGGGQGNFHTFFNA